MAQDSIMQSTSSKIEPIAEDLKNRAEKLAENVQSKAKDAFEDASDWLQDNSGKALAVAGVLAAAGIIGYLVARSASKGERINRPS